MLNLMAATLHYSHRTW